jgi:hypothetical protein
MSSLNIICVWNGTKYPADYVYKLKSMALRHLPQHNFYCLSPTKLDDINTITLESNSKHLQGWWDKMNLLDPDIRPKGKTIYFDLDTVFLGDLSKMVDLKTDFAICKNFTRQISPTYPCKYGSCVMIFDNDFGRTQFELFKANQRHFMNVSGSLGDQKVIEMIIPNADILQDMLPNGYFLHYKSMKQEVDPRARLAIFAGREKPHNTSKEWIKKQWT